MELRGGFEELGLGKKGVIGGFMGLGVGGRLPLLKR